VVDVISYTEITGDIVVAGDLTAENLIVGSTNIITEINTKQDTIQDGDLQISNTLNLQTTLTNLDTNITENTSEITTLNKNNLIYNSKTYIDKAVTSWNSRTIPTGNWKKIIWVAELNLFIGISISTSGNRMMTSSNGIDWAYVVGAPSIALQDIVWSPELSLLVAVATTLLNDPALDRPIFTSSDTITWTSQKSPNFSTGPPMGLNFRIKELNRVAWSPELNLFASISTTGYIITSSNGINWNNRGQPNGQVNGQDIIWASDRFVAVYQSGSHRVFTSFNGINWTKVVVSLNAWNSVAWSPQLSLLCAVADSGTGNRVMTSTDGTNWVDGSISDYNWESIEWSDLGMFVAVATNGYFSYSTDGFNWNDKLLSGTLRGVSWSNELSLFLVVGNDILYTSSFKNRQPTNHNIFDSEFNSINENGEWNFKSLTATTITSTYLIYGVDIDVEDKITSIETTIASHTDDIALNTANILTKQDPITSSTDLECNSLTASSAIVNSVDIGSGFTSLQTQVDALIEYITNVGFLVVRQTNDLISAGNKLPYNVVTFDTENGYNTTDFTYTIALAGTYLFTLQVFVPNGVEMSVDLIRERAGVETILQQITNGNNTGSNNSSYSLTTISEFLVGDLIFGYVSLGSVRLNLVNGTVQYASFSGSRISN
jgi:hypothetical protein